jgi:hypothetical protein
MHTDSCIWLKYNKSNELEELLFKAYLTDGKTSMISLR